MSARRDGQENAEASEAETETETQIANETDFMLMIMTATPASTETETVTVTTMTPMTMTTTTTTATATATATTPSTMVNAENKWATAAPTTFSYQRAAKRCARLQQTTATATATAITVTQNEEQTKAITTQAKRRRSSSSSRTTAELVVNPCERQRHLAERKAQLRAAFFKDFNEKQQQQPTKKHQQREQQAKAFESTQSIQQLIEKFQAMIVQQQQDQQQQQQQQSQSQLKPMLAANSAANSDEGCNAGGLSPCSSDNECDAGIARRKAKVTRCASSDSALGLEVDDVNMDVVMAPSPQRRMTLTVTDLPLRPALLPLAEPTALPDSPLTSPTNPTANVLGLSAGSVVVGSVPSKVLLEERVVAALSAPPGSRRESTQSCVSELGGMGGVRYVRTPSVVVSDYSDDITACGISMEEMEYFRLQRARCQRRCSLEASAAAAGSSGSAKDETQSDVSAASSCSNLYYCGSTISALDGGECIVNGVRVALARKSSHSSSGGDLSGGDGDGDADEDDDEELQRHKQQQQQQQLPQQQQEMQLERERDRERQLSELMAAAQLSDGFKKVGSGSINSSSIIISSSNSSNVSSGVGDDRKSQQL